MSQALRKLTATINRSKTLVVFINQIRMKIGVMFGNPETTTGGNALKFYASTRLDIRRIGALKNGDQVVGNRTSVKVVKNKVAPPFRQAEFDIYFGSGIAHEAGLVDLGAQAGLVEKSGTWYVYKGDKMGQGRENAVDFLKTNPKIALELDKAIREQYLGDKKEADKKELDKKVLDATKTSSKSGVLAGKK
jgi:recombination protein RecA